MRVEGSCGAPDAANDAHVGEQQRAQALIAKQGRLAREEQELENQWKQIRVVGGGKKTENMKGDDKDE